jgi:hypothetical protein
MEQVVGSRPRRAAIASRRLSCDCLRLRYPIRANGIAFSEAGRQLKIGQVLPVFCFREELPFVHAVVRGLLTA